MTATITLGEALQIGTMIAATAAIVAGVRSELRGVRSELKSVKDDMRGITSDLRQHETTLFSMFGQLQRVIGIVETTSKTPNHVV